MFSLENSPFASFTDRINKDLFAWTLRKQQNLELIKDYQGTLQFVKNDAQTSAILLADIGQGEGILSEGRRTDDCIVIRMKDNLFVQFKIKEAQGVLKNLIDLYQSKIKTSQAQIRKIMTSMKEVEDLIQQYSSLI